MGRGRNAWHDFVGASDDSEQCERCAVMVADAALSGFTISCPVPDCPAPANPGEACFMAPSRDLAAQCVYCGRAGGRDTPQVAAEQVVTIADLAAVIAETDTEDPEDDPAT